jgi:hypothetical protein
MQRGNRLGSFSMINGADPQHQGKSEGRLRNEKGPPDEGWASGFSSD